MHDRLARLGARLVVIGNGAPWQAAAVRDEMALPFELLVDLGLRSYRVAGLHRGWYRVLDPRLILASVRAWRRGARQKETQGDPWQLGGLLVFDGSGRLRARQRSSFPGDHWAPDRILDVIENARLST